ncbi:hypothetical protein FRB94_011964 [Tulasnella sp. JGI-2019a]|nr:hypothetical protein FRB93_012728 [Tulasnella sp. JGI-2019a]KAG9009547.1 hypothetical protein FRB94_011964 [Tulasnella sp. JGI-2019a]
MLAYPLSVLLFVLLAPCILGTPIHIALVKRTPPMLGDLDENFWDLGANFLDESDLTFAKGLEDIPDIASYPSDHLNPGVNSLEPSTLPFVRAIAVDPSETHLDAHHTIEPHAQSNWNTRFSVLPRNGGEPNEAPTRQNVDVINTHPKPMLSITSEGLQRSVVGTPAETPWTWKARYARLPQGSSAEMRAFYGGLSKDEVNLNRSKDPVIRTPPNETPLRPLKCVKTTPPKPKP